MKTRTRATISAVLTLSFFLHFQVQSIPATAAAAAAPANPFRARRDRLAKTILDKEGGPVLVLLLQRQEDEDAAEDFRPDPDFYYLTGQETGGGALLLLAAPGERKRRERRDMLFFPPCNKEASQWTGFFYCAGEADEKKADDPAAKTLALTGAEAVLPESELGAAVVRTANRSGAQTIYVLSERSRLDGPLRANEYFIQKLRERLPGLDFKELRPHLDAMRLVKDDTELAKIRQACAITGAAHQRIAGALGPGLFEYEIEADLEHEFKRCGATGIAFSSIVGSGPNGVTLHYHKNNRQMLAGELVVVDIGSEFEHYASDLTRTYPVSGKFTDRQRTIYNLVAQAQREAFKAAKAGSNLEAMDKAARDFLKGKVCGPEKTTCDTYFSHGVGHTVGLEVHDTGYSAPFQPGVVVTNEPGIYIENDAEAKGPIGVRIEDTIVITSSGFENLSPSFHTAEEVEAAMQRFAQTKEPCPR